MSRPIPPHGSWARYLGCRSRPACRCLPCVQGARRARKGVGVRRAQGISGLVPAASVAAHVQALVKAGRSFDGIAREAGLNVKTVSNVHAVRSSTLWRSTAAKLMSVQVSPDLTALVDATGAIRRLRALVAMGHSQKVLADGMPCAYTYISMLTHGRRVQVTVATDRAVKRLYGRLSMTPGESERGRAYAAKYGWDGPLAWDDDTIDDPAAVPQTDAPSAGYTDGDEAGEDFVDPVAVQRFVSGTPVDVTDAEWRVALKQCVARGMSYSQVDDLRGAENGTTEKAVNRMRKAYSRAGRELPEALRPTKVSTFGDRQVVEIRERYAAGGTSDLELSLRYGVSRETITSLLSGDTYRAAGGPIRQKRSGRAAETSRVEFNMHTGFGRAIDVAQAS